MSSRSSEVRPRLLLVDNVDSFTFMLADQLEVAGASVMVARNDAITIDDALEFDAVVLSPGPGRPEEAGLSVPLAAACIEQGKPLLGVCLGHQAIAIACGGTVERIAPVHGKVAVVRHDGSGLFAGAESPFRTARYHSLAVVEPGARLIANGWSEDGIVMALRHMSAPAHGVQFHPESVASNTGLALLRAFVVSTETSA